MQWVASTFHTTSEHGLSSVTTADGAQLGCQQSTELTPPGRFKWTRPFRRKTKTGFCECAVAFQLASTAVRTAENVLKPSRHVQRMCLDVPAASSVAVSLAMIADDIEEQCVMFEISHDARP